MVLALLFVSYNSFQKAGGHCLEMNHPAEQEYVGIRDLFGQGGRIVSVRIYVHMMVLYMKKKLAINMTADRRNALRAVTFAETGVADLFRTRK